MADVKLRLSGEAISLYLELKPGEKPDFEIVGRTATAFAEVVKEVAYILEPGTDVRLVFQSGTESSLSLNALLRSPKAKRSALLVIILTVGGWFVSDLRTYTIGKFLDSYLTPAQRQELSDEDVERIARALKQVMDGKIAKEPAQNVYRELERDPSIVSVGTTQDPKVKPPDPVKRKDFPTRSGIAAPAQTTPRKRISKSKERLLLISPVLLDADRVWRFRSLLGEASYHVDDEKFRAGLLSGKYHLAMKAGIQLTAEIDTYQVFEGGVWVITERHITKVVRVHRKQAEPDLFSEPQKPKRRKPKNKKT